MTYETAAYALVDAGLLDKMDTEVAVAVLVARSADLTQPAWPEALVQAWLLDRACVDAAIAATEKDGRSST
jgi:hypothetical protein